MKKLFLSIFLIFIFISFKAFTFYKVNNFANFLANSKNQMEIRANKIGFNLGLKYNFRFTFGLTGSKSRIILNNLVMGIKSEGINKFLPAVLTGVGYKTQIFGIGLGYQS